MQNNQEYNNGKLYYIHGYMSNPNSTKGTLFKEKLNAKPIQYRECKPENLLISDCLKRIKKEIKDDKNVTLIGSSLGGFLAAKTAFENLNVERLILLNPALIPPSVDITKIQGMPQKILLDMQDKRLFEEKISSKIFILIGTNDEVIPLNWIIRFAKSQEATVRFLQDDHSFTNKMDQLPDIIGAILNKNIKS